MFPPGAESDRWRMASVHRTGALPKDLPETSLTPNSQWPQATNRISSSGAAHTTYVAEFNEVQKKNTARPYIYKDAFRYFLCRFAVTVCPQRSIHLLTVGLTNSLVSSTNLASFVQRASTSGPRITTA
jgi:hypothetical protein